MSISRTEPCFAGPRLEDLLLGGADRAPFELVLHDLEAFIDLVLLHARAVPAQQKLDDVGGDRILAGVAPHQVLPHQVAGEGFVGLAVQGVHPEFRRIHMFSPLRVGCWARTRPSASVTTTTSAASSCSSSARTRLARPSASIGLGEEATDWPAGLANAQVRSGRATPDLDADVAAQAEPGDSLDCGGRSAGSGAFDADIRGEAFLDAEAAVGVLVPPAEAGDSGRRGKPLVGVPVPGMERHVGL